MTLTIRENYNKNWIIIVLAIIFHSFCKKSVKKNQKINFVTMMFTKNSIKGILFFVLMLSFPVRICAQDEPIDTTGYIPLFYSGALDYNLMIAASKGYDNEITRLLLKGADLSAKSTEGATPLVFAVANNHLSTVKTILSYSSDVNTLTNNYETPLLIAVKNQNLEIAELLLRSGADIDFSDYHGATSLHYASIYGYFYITDLLLYYNANIDKKAKDGTTPLMAAIWAENADVADLLIQNGANMEARDNMGFTPFHIASQNGDTTIMNLLIKKGVDIYEKNIYNWDALALTIRTDQVPALELLLKKGKNWISPERDALDPFVVASKYRRKDIIEILVKENVPNKIKKEIDQIGITVSSKFTLKDIFTGMSFAFKEPLVNGGIITGIDTKLWYTRVLSKQSENLYYQYMDKSSIAYAGLFKDFSLTKNKLKDNFAFSTSLSAAWAFGNRLKGTEISPGNRLMLIPSAGFKWTNKYFSFSGSAEYMNSEFYNLGPVWFRLGFSYNYFFDKVRAPLKTIKWY